VSERVSVLGAGNMGATLARTFLAAGRNVTVWNRTPSKCEPLVALGADVAASAADAVRASPVTVACVTRYEHVYESLSSRAADDALAGRTLVNLTWGTPADAVEMQEWADRRNAAYLDGGIPVYPSGIGRTKTSLVYAGRREVWDKYASSLTELGGASRHVADYVGAANVLALAIPGAFYQIAYVAFFEAAAYAREQGVPVTELEPLVHSALSMLTDAVDEAVDATTQGRDETDQASLAIQLDAMRTVRQAMDATSQRGALLNAVIEVMERGVDAGNGEFGCWSILRTLSDGG
jgi:3-hydroxyisobutyrate dehydrogenase-like beta-hydroxyacid dehydrogenase